jgi:hypothetical protein
VTTRDREHGTDLNEVGFVQADDTANAHIANPEVEATGDATRKQGDLTVSVTTEAGSAPSEANRRVGARQADILIEISGGTALFHSPDGKAFADIMVNGHRETWAVRSPGFRRWLTQSFYERTGGAPNTDAVQAALNTIEARAYFGSPERPIHVRVAEIDGRLYLDLADPEWRAVEIDENGWRIVDTPPARFLRAPGMQALLAPLPGGSVGALRRFVNVRSGDDFVLAVSWLLASVRPRGPYPVLVVAGEQGSAKSTFARIMRALIDPFKAPLRALPHNDRELYVSASNSHILAFDNISKLPDGISDAICCLATGGGYSARELYTDKAEVLFESVRPVILNGIDDFVTRPDLADRALILHLEPIPEERRRPERNLWEEFEAERPLILGALLDAVAAGLRRIGEVRLPKVPRMADFATWATACETANWPEGRFLSAYTRNLADSIETVIDGDPVATAVRSLMSRHTTWTGTATYLLQTLVEIEPALSQQNDWPRSPRILSRMLRRLATFLRKTGIDITLDGRAPTSKRERLIAITVAATASPAPTSSGASSASELPAHSSSEGQAEPVDSRTASPLADANATPHDRAVQSTMAENEAMDDMDVADTSAAPVSAPARWSATI